MGKKDTIFIIILNNNLREKKYVFIGRTKCYIKYLVSIYIYIYIITKNII